MARLITAQERVKQARALIARARALPAAEDGPAESFAYYAEVKDLLRQARDLVKFISYRPGPLTDEKRAAEAVLQEADQAQADLLRG